MHSEEVSQHWVANSRQEKQSTRHEDELPQETMGLFGNSFAVKPRYICNIPRGHRAISTGSAVVGLRCEAAIAVRGYARAVLIKLGAMPCCGGGRDA